MTTKISAVALVADIGGTNARFALHEDGDYTPRHVVTLQVGSYPSIDHAIDAYLRQVGLAGVPSEVCLAIACPTNQDLICMTNSAWSFSKSELRKRMRIERLEVINDFTALAYAIPHLEGDRLSKIGGGESRPNFPLAVIGPGTGLGVGGLINYQSQPYALVTEGGHVEFAPSNELEMEILRVLWRTYEHVSTERLVSGNGLVNLYLALAEIRGSRVDRLLPEQISQAALTDADPLAKEALNVFCEILGSAAGNVALTIGAMAGVYITGGIIPRMVDFFAGSGFRRRFEAKGRFSSYMATIPTYVVNAEEPGLVGAIAALKNHA